MRATYLTCCLLLAAVAIMPGDLLAAEPGKAATKLAVDANNDGFGDLLVATPGAEHGHYREGIVYFFRGGPQGRPGARTAGPARPVFEFSTEVRPSLSRRSGADSRRARPVHG